MAKSRRIGKFPQNIIINQRLPLCVIIHECLNMSLQEIGGNRHLKSSNATASYENTVKIDLHLHVVLLAPSIMSRIFLILGKLINLFILARLYEISIIDSVIVNR